MVLFTKNASNSDTLCFPLMSSLVELGAHTDWRHLLRTAQGTARFPDSGRQCTGVSCQKKKNQISVSRCLLAPFGSTEDDRMPLPLHGGIIRTERLLSVIILVTKYLETEVRGIFTPSSFLPLIMSRTRHRLVPALHSNLKSI